jgi:orotidine-5'-phosphate decarboxylase
VADSRIVFALDAPSLNEASRLVLALRDAVGMFKVGVELFVAAGPRAAEVVTETGRPLFLDLKLHDIPETVDRAVARAAALGARMLTVHASGGPAMLRRAVERAHKEKTGLEIVGVTVLTSLDASDLAALGARPDVAAHVERLAQLAWDEGVRAFVCSPHELVRLRGALGPGATLITPGVRAPGMTGQSPADDQKRSMSAGQAIALGADWIVVGRPIRDAVNPREAAQAIAHEAREALTARGGG